MKTPDRIYTSPAADEIFASPIPGTVEYIRTDLHAGEVEALRAEIDLLVHKVLTCGVAASHPDVALSRTGAYAAKWDSPQAERVRVLRDERNAYKAEVAQLRADKAELLEAATALLDRLGEYMNPYTDGIHSAADRVFAILAKHAPKGDV